MNKNLFNLFVICLLVCTASIAFYFVIFLPFLDLQKVQVEKLKLENVNKSLNRKSSQKVSLEKCLEDVMKLYEYDWNGNCKIRNLSNECILEPELAIMINNRRDSLKKECIEKYPQQ